MCNVIDRDVDVRQSDVIWMDVSIMKRKRNEEEEWKWAVYIISKGR